MAKSDFRFFCPLRVRYVECDKQGIVFNGHYAMYFDVAITEYMRNLGYRFDEEAAKSHIDFHQVKLLIEYKAPCRFDDEMEIYTRIARLGRTSHTYLFETYLKGEDTLRTSGELVSVAADQRSMSPVPNPEKFVEAVKGFEGGSLWFNPPAS